MIDRSKKHSKSGIDLSKGQCRFYYADKLEEYITDGRKGRGHAEIRYGAKLFKYYKQPNYSYCLFDKIFLWYEQGVKIKILVTDDEEIPKRRLCRLIYEVMPESELRAFSSPLKAIQEVKPGGFRPDIAFLDIEMFGMNGLEL